MGCLEQVPSRCSGSRPLRPADIAARSYQSEVSAGDSPWRGLAGGRYGALKAGVRSAAADEFAAAYQSECAAGGRYGALKIAVAVAARSGPPTLRRGRTRARSPQATRCGELWPEAGTER